MSRIQPIEPRKAGIFARLGFWISRRKFGKVLGPLYVTAHHPQVLAAVAFMEGNLARAHELDAGLKALVSVRVAMRIGCPF